MLSKHHGLDIDVIFIKPTKIPKVYPELWLDKPQVSGYEHARLELHWDLVERRLETILQDFNNTRAELRRIEIEGNK